MIFIIIAGVFVLTLWTLTPLVIRKPVRAVRARQHKRHSTNR